MKGPGKTAAHLKSFTFTIVLFTVRKSRLRLECWTTQPEGRSSDPRFERLCFSRRKKMHCSVSVSSREMAQTYPKPNSLSCKLSHTRVHAHLRTHRQCARTQAKRQARTRTHTRVFFLCPRIGYPHHTPF